MSPRKTTTKAAAAEVKEAVKATPVTTEDKKTETTAKKAPAKRAAAKKETAAAKKTTAAKTEVKETVFVQFAGAEYSLDDVKANVKKAWMAETGKQESDIKNIQIYVKPEEHAAYYVVNGEFVEGGRKVEL